MRIIIGLNILPLVIRSVTYCWAKTSLRCMPLTSLVNLCLLYFVQVSSKEVVVQDSDGKEIVSQLLPLSNFSLNTRNYHVKAYLGVSPGNTPSYWLAFSAFVPPLGFSTYIISTANKTGYYIGIVNSVLEA